MEIKEQLYEGKAKKVFATDDPDLRMMLLLLTVRKRVLSLVKV